MLPHQIKDDKHIIKTSPFDPIAFANKLGIGFRDAYLDIAEIENYRRGSLFEGLTTAGVLEKILKKAIEIGLP